MLLNRTILRVFGHKQTVSEQDVTDIHNMLQDKITLCNMYIVPVVSKFNDQEICIELHASELNIMWNRLNGGSMQIQIAALMCCLQNIVFNGENHKNAVYTFNGVTNNSVK